MAAFLKNVEAFEAKRRGVLKKRLDAFNAGNVGTLSKSIGKSYKIFGL